MRGATGERVGRTLDVRFRFPATVSNTPGLVAVSTWVVVPGQSKLALLSFQDVHRHFTVRTFEFDAYFVLRPLPLPN